MTSRGLVSKSKIDAIKSAIRAKGAGSASMTLDQMATAIGTIGGGSTPTGTISITENGTYDVAAYASAAVNVSSSGGDTSLADAMIQGTATEIVSGATSVRNSAFSGYSALQKASFPSATGSIGVQAFYSCGNLAVLDVGGASSIGMFACQSCSKLKTLILRRSTALCGIQANSFQSTPMASGGSGITVYIPKALYDHLGDGTALDYKAATNWSTYDGYGTITWAKIEGSEYE